MVPAFPLSYRDRAYWIYMSYRKLTKGKPSDISVSVIMMTNGNILIRHLSLTKETWDGSWKHENWKGRTLNDKFNSEATLLSFIWGLCITDPIPGRDKRSERVSHVCTLYTVLSSLIFLLWSGMEAGSCVLFSPVHWHIESQIPENQLCGGSGIALLCTLYLHHILIFCAIKSVFFHRVS